MASAHAGASLAKKRLGQILAAVPWSVQGGLRSSPQSTPASLGARLRALADAGAQESADIEAAVQRDVPRQEGRLRRDCVGTVSTHQTG